MALDTPLNTRQLDVLRWINEGCPDGQWAKTSYKATAAALQNRRLVTVSKRGGWKATIEPAGTYYLKHGDYPTDHFPNKRRSYSRSIRLAHSEQGNPQRSLTRPGPDEPTPTRKLLQDIIEAGGVLEINTRDDDTNYGSLVAIINRSVPQAQDQTFALLRTHLADPDESVRGDRRQHLSFTHAVITTQSSQASAKTWTWLLPTRHGDVRVRGHQALAGGGGAPRDTCRLVFRLTLRLFRGNDIPVRQRRGTPATTQTADRERFRVPEPCCGRTLGRSS